MFTNSKDYTPENSAVIRAFEKLKDDHEVGFTDFEIHPSDYFPSQSFRVVGWFRIESGWYRLDLPIPTELHTAPDDEVFKSLKYRFARTYQDYQSEHPEAV